MIKRIKDAFWGTVFIFVIVLCVKALPNIDAIDPIADALRDYNETDIVFSKMFDEQPIDTNITIVNFAQVDRATIGRMLEIIGKHKPAVVGIDAFFRSEKGPMQDFPLMMGMSKVENLVLVSELDSPDTKTGHFNRVNKSNPMFLDYASTGFANVVTGENEHEGGFRTVREFIPRKTVRDSLELNFTAKIVSYFDSSALKDLLARDKEEEVIKWRGPYSKFFTLGVDNVLNEQFDPSIIKGKIVLFGYIGEYVGDDESHIDKFYTPLNERMAGRAYPDMYGITVHANVISMILNRTYIDRLPEWANFLMYAFVTFLNVLLFLYIAEKRRTWYDVITKPFQIVELVLFLAIPVWVLYYWNFQVDISNILITVAFAGDITELYASTIRGFALKQIGKAKSLIQN